VELVLPASCCMVQWQHVSYVQLRPILTRHPNVAAAAFTAAVRYIETFHKWAGTAANPQSPWHNQQPGVKHSPGMMSNSPGPGGPVFMMDD
jgi:hypothetical protein